MKRGLIVLLLLLSYFLPGGAWGLQYNITDLGTLPGGTISSAYFINNSGQVGGYAESSSGFYHAVVWRPNADGTYSITDLGTLGGNYSSAQFINDSSQVAGFANTPSGIDHAVVWRPNADDTYSITDLGTLGGTNSYAYFINNSGQVAGCAHTSSGYNHAVVWRPNADGTYSITDLGTLGGYISIAQFINDSGQVGGYARNSSNSDHAVVWRPNADGTYSITDLGTLGGNYSYAEFIDDSGQVVGYAQNSSAYYHAVVWRPNADGTYSITDLGTLGGTSSYAYFISNSGQVVGCAYNSSSSAAAFLWDPTMGMQNILSLSAPGHNWTSLVSALEINANGQIVGYGAINGQTHGFLATPGNQPPTLSPIGNQSVQEGQTLEFTVSATDPEGKTLIFSAGALPSGASFDPVTHTFTWTPGYDQAGSYPVTFRVTDGGFPPQSASETIIITAGNVNRPPELALIGPRLVNENESLQFQLAAADPDGDPLTYSASNLPSGAQFDQTTHTFSWTPNYNQSNVYTDILFSVTDGDKSDSEFVTITVGDVNRPPVMAEIPNPSILENQPLDIIVTANDPDGNALSYSASNPPTGMTFSPEIQAFKWTPSYDQGGQNYTVTFTVTDNGSPPRSDSKDVIISVGNVNRAPSLDPVGNKDLKEGEALIIILTANDSDGDGLAFSTSSLPSGASFDAATRTFTWTPGYDQAGTYKVTFTVTDDADDPLSSSEEVTLTVGNANRAPVLEKIGAKTIAEGNTLSLQMMATDPDGDNVTFEASDLPPGASLTPEGAFSWTPKYDQAGNFTVFFKVKDNGTPALADSEEVTITVGNVNRPPVLNSISDQSIGEGNTLTFTIAATDPDGDTLTYSASGVPKGAQFDPETRTFTWTPSYLQAGNYPVLFTATDNGSPAQSDSKEVVITVGNVNRAPQLDAIGNKQVNEGGLLELTVTATDPDGDGIAYSASNLPAGATFNQATGLFSWNPAFDQAGSYPNVRFTATDSGSPCESSSEEITITVGNVNRPPVLDPIGSKTVNEGETLVITLTGSDPDGNSIAFKAGPIPVGSNFSGQTFTWTPGYGQAGNYEVEFFVEDSGDPMELAVEIVPITVGKTNRAPIFDPVGTKQVKAGQEVSFYVQANDPDGDDLTYSAAALPPGAVFSPATRLFAWTPGSNQVGIYSITFYASDGALTGETTVVISVSQPSISELLGKIIKKVLDLNLSKSVENSYMANLKKVDTFLADGQKTPAINQLNAFIGKVKQDMSKGLIKAADGAELVSMTTELLGML